MWAVWLILIAGVIAFVVNIFKTRSKKNAIITLAVVLVIVIFTGVMIFINK